MLNCFKVDLFIYLLIDVLIGWCVDIGALIGVLIVLIVIMAVLIVLMAVLIVLMAVLIVLMVVLIV